MPRIRLPTDSTLRRYGLTKEEWRDILRKQGDVCPICRRFPPSGLWATDHEHVKGFKKMSPSERRRFVRGVVCRHCNHKCLGRFMTLWKARNVARYLEKYEVGR